MEPVYEGFKNVGEAFVCTACGHRYGSRAETPFLEAEGRPRVFTEADRPAVVEVFKSSERRHCCAWCRHFIVNPFNQRCGLANREVEATDVCSRFAARPEGGPGEKEGDAPDRLDTLFGGGGSP